MRDLVFCLLMAGLAWACVLIYIEWWTQRWVEQEQRKHEAFRGGWITRTPEWTSSEAAPPASPTPTAPN